MGISASRRAPDPKTVSPADHSGVRPLHLRGVPITATQNVRVCSAGQLLLEQGEEAEAVFLIHKGAFKLIWVDGYGSEVILGVRLPGLFLGAAALLSRTPYVATAAAMTPSIVERIPHSDFLYHLKTRTDFTESILKSLAAENVELERYLSEFRSGKLPERLPRFLRYLAEQLVATGVQRAPIYSLRKQEVAQALGVTTEHLSRTLRDLAVPVESGPSQEKVKILDPGDLGPDSEGPAQPSPMTRRRSRSE